MDITEPGHRRYGIPGGPPATNEFFSQNTVHERLILEAAKDYAIFTTDLQRRVTSWSVGAEAIFGYAEADIIGQLADVLFVPEDRPSAPDYEFGKAQTEGQAENERWHLRKDGSRIYGSGIVTPLRDDTGTIIGLVKIMRDLTRQKQAEEALSQSEERFRAFVTATSDVVYRMSADWQQMHQLVGKSFLPDTNITSTFWLEQYIPPQDQAGVRAAIGEAIQAKKTFELEHRVIQADGSLGWTFSRAIPLLNEQGEIMEWFGTASDITEYKKAEDALAKSKEKYRTLFNSIDEGFCTIEILFDEQHIAVDYRFLEANPAFIRQTGLENSIGKTIRELAPEHEPFWFETYGRIAQTGEAVRFEHQAAALNRFYDVYAFRIGEPVENRVAVLFNDITARKRREANLVFLAEVSQDLAGLATIDETMNALGEKLATHLGLSACAFAELTEEAHMAVINHGWHQADMPSLLGTYRMDEFVTPEVLRLCRAGKAVIIGDAFDDPMTDGENMQL